MPILPRRKRLRLIVRIVASGLLLLLVAVAPIGFFYLNWIRPSEDLAPVEASSGVYQADEAVPAPLLDANLGVLFEARNSTGMPSLSAAIGYDGRIQWAGTVGFAHLEESIPSTLSSRYRIGSVSKALTGVLLGRLFDKGVVTLDQSASTLLPDLPPQFENVTVGMLASHTAGVRHYSIGPSFFWPPWHPFFSGKQYSSVEEGLEIFMHDELQFSPGTDFQYSTYGYSLLSRVMEAATGSSFQSLLQQELFLPAELTHTAVDEAGLMPARASFYVTSLDAYTAAYPTNSSYKIAGGGMVSTPSDLARLGQLLLHANFISEKAQQLLWSPVELEDGTVNAQNYGLGWRIEESTRLLGEDKPTTIIHHGGRQNGGVGFLMLVPEYGISVAALANTGSGPARGGVQDVAYELVRLAIGHDAAP